MHKAYQNLTPDEYSFLLEVPMYITILVAGADAVIDMNEVDWAEKITHFRTLTEKFGLREYYRDVDAHFHENLMKKIVEIKEMDETVEERNLRISEILMRINDLLPKLDKDVATRLYHSYKTLAHQIADSSGGVLGFGAISPSEKLWVELRMLDDPSSEKKPY